ncbi:hypothetical protein C0J52_03515 [Blattella germanica]|nr:hypothetical protein C0J52_03515 [Blattella germanica]
MFSDGYYEYHSDHSIERRSLEGIQVKLPPPPPQSAEVHINETVSSLPTTTTQAPSVTVNSSSSAGVNYNVTNNSSGVSPDVTNRTSQLNSTVNVTSTGVSNGSSLTPQGNSTVTNNSSDAVSNNTDAVYCIFGENAMWLLKGLWTGPIFPMLKTVKLSFHFPFYGHVVRNVTVATGGFLYTGEYVHSWLAATQYIAPLMANFDTSISKDSYVKYIDNGTAFTVQWEKVVLQDKPTSGDFTFQATLHQNGDIVFVYQNVPVVIKSIQDDQHPVKVGLSDAYIIDRTIFCKEVQCLWCPLANRCSTGTDRNRQDWLNRGCDKSSISNPEKCPAVPTNVSQNTLSPTSGISNHIGEGETNSAAQTDHTGENTGDVSIAHGDNVTVGISGIIGILFIVVLVASLGIWALYAYRNPHTASGQFLIRYRPSQWSWKRGEARYTAATIHM